MKMEFDISKMVEKIAMQAKENQEEFIFQTIQPYCENIIEQRISKKELELALLQYFNKPKLIKEWLSTFNTESATECFTAVQQLKEIINDRGDTYV